MSERTEELLENIKMYLGIIAIMLILLDGMLIAGVYSEYGAIITYNEAMNHLIFGLIIVTIVIVIAFLVLCIVLRKQQGDMYISLLDMLETVRDMLFPTLDIRNKMQLSQMLNLIGDKKETQSTVLWKAAAEGIQVWNMVKAIFLFAFGSEIVCVVINEWKDMDDQRILTTIIGSLFVIILYFWGVVCAIGIKKRPDYVLDYVICNQVSFAVLNEDFSIAQNYGNQIYKGEQYVFVNIGKGMQVVAIKDITECKINRMAGWNPRRLFLPYYILEIVTETSVIMKYGINPASFYKLREDLYQK